MSYRPGDARDPYTPRERYGPHRDDYPDRDRPYHDGGDTVIAVIRVIVGVTVTIFALHVLFVVLGANQGNAFVSFDYALARTLVLGLGDVFTPHDAVLGVVLDYSLAALLYVVIAQLVIKALRRR